MQTRSSSSGSANLVPREAKLQIVNSVSFRGKILPGWTVVNRPRSSSASANTEGRMDKYFIEPGTGRQFPSIESVQKHLTGEVNDRRLSRVGFFTEKTRVYEGARTKQNRRIMEYASKGFRLPKGWTVEEFPRKNSHQIDKYYVERKTGNRFRSLVSVERYLNEPRNHTDQQVKLLEYHRPSKDFKLPEGWIIEEKPRRNSSQIDKLYIEPGTGNKFRSMSAVERYLNTVENSTVDSDSMVHSEQLSAKVFDLNPPEKVKWVLTGPGGNVFNAHVDGSDISSSVKQTWSEAFVSLIQDRS